MAKFTSTRHVNWIKKTLTRRTVGRVAKRRQAHGETAPGRTLEERVPKAIESNWPATKRPKGSEVSNRILDSNALLGLKRAVQKFLPLPTKYCQQAEKKRLETLVNLGDCRAFLAVSALFVGSLSGHFYL